MLIDCETCAARVNAKSLGQYDYTEYEEVAPGERAAIAALRVVFLQCPVCSEPMLAQMETNGAGQPMGSPYRIFPVPRRVKAAVPGALRRLFSEAGTCLQHRAFVATLLMCRRTVEAICEHKGETTGNLAQKLNALHTKGVIDATLYEWAEALREQGNLAAHSDVDVTIQDARDLLAFTEALLDYVFVLREQFDAFKARRAARAT